MKTVPTLCATATVVGASAVGLSFGREAPFDSTHSSKRKTALARELTPAPMPTAVQTQTVATTTASSTSSHYAPIPISPTSRAPFSSRASQDGRSQRRIVRRKTSDDAALQVPPRPSSMVYSYAPSDQGTTESESAARLPTRRPSWMRRLSAISNSQHSSRNPSPAPLSPSLSYSNGSMAFSNDGSTAPMVGKRSASPLPPNKLVKRSSSVRVPRETPIPGSVSLRPSFRRPATSHQRSATLQHHTALLEMTVEDPSIDAQLHSASTDSEVEYTQYFTAKVATGRTLAKRRGSNATANGFRRVFPDDKHPPTLVLARSVSASAEDMDESTSDDGDGGDGDSVFFVSRPGTPMSITAVFATKAERSQSRPQPSAPAQASDDAVRSRRSFSITDLLSSASGARRQRLANAHAPPSTSASSWLSRGFSQRASSAPLLPTMRRRPNSASYGEARRDVTDPGLPTRNIATSAGPATPPPPPPPPPPATAARNGDDGGSLSSLAPAAPDRRTSGGPQDSLAQLAVIASAAAPANHTPPSPTLAQPGVRPSRHSTAPSEQASTLVGSSDNEIRGVGSGDEDDADFHSETLFDSLRTGATRSTSGGARGPRIETIFDESPPSKVRVTALRDLLPPGSFGEHTINGATGHQSIAEEEESISTPVRTVRPERSLQESPSCSRGLSAPLFPNSLSSSPPSMPKPLSLGTLAWDPRAGDDDDSISHTATPVSLSRQNPHLLPTGPSSKPTTPHHLTADHPDRDARSSIFDWSEQQIADKTSGNHSPPRPRTVHGKKDADHRGSRSVGRRVPSGLHARSQSVPVVPDAAGKRNTVVTNKFGTWGVGSKGVTEDWNDDFDFSELAEEPAAGAENTPKIDNATVMVVPKSIQEQQNNVLANIGLLREWGLLIEELKEHRVRAVALDLVDGIHSGMWEEVDAMIDLADQEAEHENVARMSPPSSPGFDEDAFDDAPNASPSNGRGRRKSGSPHDDLTKTPTQSAHPRRSILPSQHGLFSPQSSPVPPKSKFETPSKTEQNTIITRPRKDSEAKARSVIEALQNKRKSIIDSVPNAPPTPSSKKVPFDTATLRRIVPYVSTLTRKVKDTIREAEGLYSSPHTSPMNEEPSFSKMFQQDADLAAQMKLMTVT
ncbi:hypothetical protein T440DRAFT_107022 [Plenodomus tracheiphilus IPT5]|uniref:Uncharacterized protein n=1 Tax=Plenodomus tracheiphilus IPT5 TaxID=1408161 RepID=A0A6A7BM20_9PLEO|nr:hypothetical protein T440DRAFT_107022 [Plenodomus tracheiphilus IPT5]